MVGNENHHRLVEGAYAAAIDDSLWASWTTDIVGWLGGAGGTLSVLEPQSSTIKKLIAIGWAEVESDYHGHWWQFDPLVPAVLKPDRLCTLLDTDHVDLKSRETAAYMAWQRGKAGLDHHLAATVPLGGGALRAGLSIHRSNQDGYTPYSEQEKLAAILPQIASAMCLGFKHAEMLLNSFWEGIVVGRDSQMALLLDEYGKVIRHTSSAHELIARRDGLDIVNGRLIALQHSSNAPLDKVIGQAVDAALQQSGAIRLPRPSGKRPLIIVCYPLPRSSRMLAPAEAAALVIIIDPATRVRSATRIYRDAFGFTPREAEFAEMLVKGHSIESAAAALEMSKPTARQHLRQLLAKSGTSRQSGLLQLLARVG